MPSTEDVNQRIRVLCARVVMAPDSEIQFVLEDLQTALREYVQLVENDGCRLVATNAERLHFLRKRRRLNQCHRGHLCPRVGPAPVRAEAERSRCKSVVPQ
jgi:hypothetical protein